VKKLWSALVVLALIVGAGAARAQSNLVLFISSPGDYIGLGGTYLTTDTNSFSVSATPSLITVDAFGFNFWIASPRGATLHPGFYANSARRKTARNIF
jgi:hypothetical protein